MIKRIVNAAVVAANRANAAKAHGAITEHGREVVRFNAAQHWGRAETMRELLPALGEHAEDFEELRQCLYDGLQPEDAFETVLVDDMADTHGACDACCAARPPGRTVGGCRTAAPL